MGLGGRRTLTLGNASAGDRQDRQQDAEQCYLRGLSTPALTREYSGRCKASWDSPDLSPM